MLLQQVENDVIMVCMIIVALSNKRAMPPAAAQGVVPTTTVEQMEPEVVAPLQGLQQGIGPIIREGRH